MYKVCILALTTDQKESTTEVIYHGLTEDGWEEIPAETPAEATHLCDFITSRPAARAEVLAFFKDLEESGEITTAQFNAAISPIMDWGCGETLFVADRYVILPLSY